MEVLLYDACSALSLAQLMMRLSHIYTARVTDINPPKRPILSSHQIKYVPTSSLNMVMGKSRSLPEAVAATPLSILTWSYSGAYAYHTVNPIETIRENQHDTANLIRALAYFRNTKNEELIFVSRAVSLPPTIALQHRADLI